MSSNRYGPQTLGGRELKKHQLTHPEKQFIRNVKTIFMAISFAIVKF